MKARSLVLYLLYFWLFFFGVVPLLMMFVSSFLSKGSIHLVAFPATFENYSTLWSFVFAKILFRSLVIAGITTFFCLLIAYPFSYLLIRSKHQSILLLLIFIPFWTSSLIRTYSLIAFLKYKGIFNALLLKLHIIHVPLSLLYTNFAVIIGLVYNLFPFMVLPIFTNMERFDFRLFEASRDLGANRWAIFTRVFVPNTAPGVMAGCLLVLLPAMTLFYIPNVLGGARSILLGNLIQNQFLTLSNWPQGSATSIVLTLLLLVLLALFRHQKNEVLR